MRRYWVLALAVLTLFAGLAPPAFAQAPKPKVTITGFIDVVSQWDQNMHDTDATNRETTWHSRERARFFFKGEVGKAHAMWAAEQDFALGNTVKNLRGTSAGLDLDTDVAGKIETKWLYLEFPATGPGSVLPFIPVPTVARGGGQPFRGHDFKPGVLASIGDFGGLNLVTTFAPGVKNTFTFAQIEEQVAGAEGGFPDNRESWAIIDSLEVVPLKGLTIKPTVSYARFDGLNQGGGNLGTTRRGGFDPGGNRLWRVTVGGDLRWRFGPWELEPTFHYQFGDQQVGVTQIAPGGKGSVDIDAWYADVIGSWRSGPLKLELRFIYTPGNKADECVQSIPGASGTTCRGGSDINYYEPIDHGFAYPLGWSEIGTGTVEYLNGFLGGVRALQREPSYDKYGRITPGVKATYAVTPAFSLFGVVTGNWTAEDVDTNGKITSSGITPGDAKGDASYYGTELNVGFHWDFAPRLTFSATYARLFTGDALKMCVPQSSSCDQPRDPKDPELVAARVRFRF